MAKAEIKFGELGGGGYELAYKADSFPANVAPTISTTKKAKGFVLSYAINNNLYVLKAIDGKDNNNMFFNDVVNTNYTITFNENSIVFSRYISGNAVPYQGYIIY